MTELILGIISIVLSLAGYAIPEVISSESGKIKGKINTLARDVYSKISDDQRLLDKLYSAYTNNQTQIMNSIIQGSGFGNRAVALEREMRKQTKEYEDKRSEITGDMAKHNNQYNELQNSLVNAGTSLAGTKQAKETYKNIYKEEYGEDPIEQNVNGGLKVRSTPGNIVRNGMNQIYNKI